MTKQSNAKELQVYQEKPFIKTCANCLNYAYDGELIRLIPSGELRLVETNIRCYIGQFKIKKTAICDKWEIKNEQ